MESVAHLEVSAVKVARRYETDYSLCIICQKAEGLLVEKPTLMRRSWNMSI